MQKFSADFDHVKRFRPGPDQTHDLRINAPRFRPFSHIWETFWKERWNGQHKKSSSFWCKWFWLRWRIEVNQQYHLVHYPNLLSHQTACSIHEPNTCLKKTTKISQANNYTRPFQHGVYWKPWWFHPRFWTKPMLINHRRRYSHE